MTKPDARFFLEAMEKTEAKLEQFRRDHPDEYARMIERAQSKCLARARCLAASAFYFEPSEHFETITPAPDSNYRTWSAELLARTAAALGLPREIVAEESSG